MREILYNPQVREYVGMTLKMFLACFLGGIIGFERESMNRPAGLRTHILVCVGSALVMLTSTYVFDVYRGMANLDPARLGAQVISGIGFLGAGTIIRDGASVKGLTTAASLWAVACIGLAIGIGFYAGALIATAVILLSLIVFKRIEDNMTKKKRQETFFVNINKGAEIGQVVAAISRFFALKSIVLKNISFMDEGDDVAVVTQITVKMPYNFKKDEVIAEIIKIPGVEKTYQN